MSYRLSEDDQRAVDLILDQQISAGGRKPAGGHHDGAAAPATVATRLQAVERVLTALDAMPATEPSDDLLARTLRRVAQAAPVARPTLTAPGASVATQPVA